MPRFLVETYGTSPTELARVERLAAQRFPEITLEHRYAVGDDGDRRDVWVCRASSDTHLRRWAHASALVLHAVRRIEDDAVIGTAQGAEQ